MRVTAAVACLVMAIPGWADQPWSEATPELGQMQRPEGVLSKDALEELTHVGEALFVAKFTTLDGAGRPEATQAILPTKPRRSLAMSARLSGPDAHSCAACHNDPVIGGAGDFVTNVFVSEGFTAPDFTSTDPQFSNERGTNHLFGAGLVELLAREMTADLHALRANGLKAARDAGESIEIALQSKGVDFGVLLAHPDGQVDLSGIDGLDSDLVIRPFSQKGVMTSLRQFTVNALNHHHGMQSSERFGSRWTGTGDFDEDQVPREITEGDVSALVAWQATLPVPKQIVPVVWETAAEAGAVYFDTFGCTDCHRATLPLRSLKFSDPGPLDAAGTLNVSQVPQPAIYDIALLDWAKSLPRNDQGDVLVPLFGDLKRHKMTDQEVDGLGNELMSQRFVDRNIFQTSELWGIGSTAPYGHRNDFTTLHEVIMEHGGDARYARDRFAEADDQARSELVAFLKTLVIEP